MWTSFIETLKSKPIQKISIFSNNQRVTYSEVIELWQDNNAFNSFFSSLLAEAPFSAYFWETPPITLSTVNKAFEFVLVDSPQLAPVQPDSSSFRQYFQSAQSSQDGAFKHLGFPQVSAPPKEVSPKDVTSSVGEEVITFPNLRKDALLVVPCPIAENSAYRHIASFVREAPQSQQHALWQTVGKVIQQNINDQPIWVSTSGLGVYWLHIRLDSYPKYYTFNPYKVWE